MMHVRHVAWPDNQFTFFTWRNDPLVRESSAAPGGIGEVEHPNQSALTVFNTIALTVDSGVAATFGIPLDVGMLGKPERTQAISARAVVINLKIRFHMLDQTIEKCVELPVHLDGYGDIEGVLHALVDSGIFAKPSRLCLMPMLLEEIDNPITHRGVDFIGFDERANSHKVGTEKALELTLIYSMLSRVYGQTSDPWRS
jgi:hypothetical protein